MLLILIIIQTYLITMISCSFLMLHLSYYVITHYIRLLKITLAKNLPFKSMGINDKYNNLYIRLLEQVKGSYDKFHFCFEVT